MKIVNFVKTSGGRGIYYKVGFLSNIIGALNHLKLSFQEINCTLTEFISKLGVCQEVIYVYRERGENTLQTAQTPDNTWEQAQWWICKKKNLIISLKIKLNHYFQEMTCENCACIANQFSVEPGDSSVDTGEQEEFVHIKSDRTAK